MSKKKIERQFHLISLGCSKNSVDSRSMAALLERASYREIDDPDKAGILIVNTCGFIDNAREESLSVLKELAAKKEKDQIIIAAGCLSQRFGPTIAQEVKGIDGVIGTRRWMDIVRFVHQIKRKKRIHGLFHLPDEAKTVGRDERGVVRAAVHGASAYLKISDGCRRPCAFCIIPQIKGTLVSRPLDEILSDARALRDSGVKELIIISQDSSDYGHDLRLKNGLGLLLNELVKAVPDIEWIRVMYTYPGYVTDELIETMASNPQILPYLDMPLQHAHRETLKRMRRPANTEWIYSTIGKLRSAMPELALRTTFIVGYPGETEEEFQHLLDFIEDIRFDRVGVFPYSYEESTPSASVSWQVPEDVKKDRLARLMTVQQSISLNKNQAFIGQTLPVLIEGRDDSLSIGRSYRDAPEVDGLVIVSEELPLDEIVLVKIDGALTYDLTGYPMPGNSLAPERSSIDELRVI